MEKELKVLINQKVELKYHVDSNHVFIVGAHINTLEKELLLVKCIKKLREFDIPIILTTHYQIIPEIQNLVDYFICDNKNELLYFDRFPEFNINNLRWTSTTNWDVNNYQYFHHDFAAITIIKNGVILAKELNKTKLHYIDYDTIIDPLQYYQTFIRDMNYHDISYGFLFSLDINLAEKIFVNDVTTLEDHFKKQEWRFEDFLITGINKYAISPKKCDYLNIDKSFNIIAAWNRMGINRNGAFFDIFLCANEDDLYIHLISNTSNCYTPTSSNIFLNVGVSKKDYLIEIKYREYSKFYNLKLGAFDLIKLGKYSKNERVIVKYMGVKVYDEVLKFELEEFKKMNNVTFKN